MTYIISRAVSHPIFYYTVVFLILLNGVMVGAATYESMYEPNKTWFDFGFNIILWCFTIEIVMRLISSKPTSRYFADGWNVFDFIIVLSGHVFAGAHGMTVLRVLRILRVLRAVTVIPSLKKLVTALLLSIPALGNVVFLLCIIFYIFGVIGTVLLGEVSPEYFGALHLSLITLFQVVTLESWASEIMRPILETAPWAWVYFISFILIGAFVIFNLFIGVIVNTVHRVEEETKKEKEEAIEIAEDQSKGIEKELFSLKNEVKELKSLIRKSGKP